MGQSKFINIVSQYFNNLSLRKQLLAAFLLTALLPLFVLSFFFYEFSKNLIVKEATQRLESIAKRQADQIRTYFDEQERFVSGLAMLPFVASEIEKLDSAFKNGGVGTPEYEKLYQDLFTYLASYQHTTGFEDLLLISTNGNLLFSMKKGEDFGSNLRTGPFKNTDLAKVFDNSATLLEMQSSDFNYYSATNGPAAFIGSPVIDKKGNKLAGVIILQLNNDDIYNVVNEYQGLGETGETVILSQSGDKYTYMTPTRHDPSAAFRRTIKTSDPKQSMLKDILNGDQTTKIVTDYRGQKTLAYGKYFLPSLGWSIVVKMDTSELFKPIKTLKTFLIIGLISMLGLILAAIFAFTKSIHQPIQMLTDYTRMIASGNLAVHIPVRSKNEIGVLSSEFNQMTAKLEEIVQSLEIRLENKTALLKDKNENLSRTLEELKIMQKRMIAQAKLASLGGLTAGIAHEIRNPLNFVDNFSTLTLELIPFFENIAAKVKPTLASEEAAELLNNISTLKENLTTIREQVIRTNNIVQRMLSHSKGEPGKAALYNIHQLLKEAIDLAYHGFRVQFPTFNTAIDKQFETEDLQLTILGEDISRVFINLLNNAFYAVNAMSLRNIPDYSPTVWVKTKIVGPNFEVHIRDNGIGIPVNVQKRLFSPFFTTKPAGEGTGLGLSLSHAIVVDEHKGSITCESVEGEFAEFSVILPLDSSQNINSPISEIAFRPTQDKLGV